METIGKAIVGIVSLIVEFFLGAFVVFKIYGYFSPHVGFDLPQLSLPNIIALSFVIGGLFLRLAKDLKIAEIHENSVEKEEGLESVDGDEFTREPVIEDGSDSE